VPRTSVVAKPSGADRFPTGVVLASIITSIVLRARFITTPISADEGGYLAVARAWASGKGLYSEAWVDRPQGLLVLFRIWDGLTGGSPAAIRVMAILFGCIAVASVAYTVFAIAGARAAGIASILVAVASANARIEGFIANGELLAGGAAAAGVATASAYLFRGRDRKWLFASGVLAGFALSFKQSGFDGFLAVMVCLVAGGLTGERRWRQVLRECMVCTAGLASVLTALFLHGLLVGFGRWWYALAGYRLGGINATSRADWHRFGITSWIAAPTILPLLVAAAAGVVVWLARSRRITRSNVLLAAWVCFACLAFLTGGLFHRHYWVTLTFPLAAAAAVAIAKINGRLLVATALVVIPSLISTAQVIVLGRSAVAVEANDDQRLPVNERIGDWYIQHRTPGSTLYALCASAALYANADAIPPYPYLWYDGVINAKGAQDQLVRLFAGDDPPTFVAVYQDARACNPSGQVEALLKERYITTATVDTITILMLRTSDSSGVDRSVQPRTGALALQPSM
jgi:hypothetical protein